MSDSLNLPLDPAAARAVAIRETFRGQRRQLLDFIRRRIPDREDPEDLLQDVFVQLVNSYDAIESLEKLSSWLFTVARNKITDLYRKKRPQRFSDLSSEDSDAPLHFTEVLDDLAARPDVMYRSSAILDALELALAELPEKQRQVFVMHEFENKSFQEIAAFTGDPINTLLSRKRYAVIHLREKLKNLYDEL
ncbi:MAG: sigma-70 family RNA polymerase sigma factor [Bacteroidetes bacterium]|nr:MAG: sigma-70 family RNA polymerase sigma factor [Bacteroidota bacterium]